MDLDAEQLGLLLELIETAQGIQRPERKFYLSRTDGEDVLQWPGGSRRVLGEDISDLISAGMLRRRGSWTNGDVEFTIAQEGLAYAEQHGALRPLERIADSATRYLDEPSFRARYPSAYQRWQEAASLLWSQSSVEELTTIGHKTREAVQEFATTVVELANLEDAVDDDPAHTVARIRSVLNANRGHLGSARHQLLDALVGYWGGVNDLLQRQEHGGQKEGQPLSWEDGRRAVFHSAVVMSEIDRILEFD